jgi:hypothetical protein
LQPGEFYVSTDGMPMPVKTLVERCLSWHPESPLDAAQLLERVQRTAP